MAGTSLLALIDDIASTLDDVAVLTKVAAKKTSGVLGDDLALNAEQVSGVASERELPVVWAVAKGSVINKIILVPSALLISQLLPWLVTPLLMLGGAYLCFEGFEKVFEKLLHAWNKKSKNQSAELHLVPDLPVIDEAQKIKGAIRTDFILSAEIVVIALGTVTAEPLLRQFLVLAGIATVMTIGVYGLVAAIVKLDDAGLYLNQKHHSRFSQILGSSIVTAAPRLMKALGVVGTIAMFLVGGGILVHGISYLHHMQVQMSSVTSSGLSLVTGIVGGGLVFLLVKWILKPLRQWLRPS
ncbi:DUF808 domain-containing protein [Pseudobdellovibrio exovorus]|uniref:DUF808 domain-containing protein n=1 Tax=Pseudobdellovibrio exovorus JSS TaxID=1184267 RepID=M4V5D3_9BACT|nr:DUF808 domain-containing protein [Pseudobdellovibrio exovorus]AGH94537.1 hypothetical protein A11Q_317 [Pseudobdellovibrio exovorus JSS]